MRQRKARDLERRLQECGDYIKKAPEDGNWEKLFAGNCEQKELYLEIGCGKGQFIIKKAADNPEGRYIAIEGQETVILRAAEKARAVAGEIPWPENVGGEEKLEAIRQKLAQGQEKPLGNLIFTACFVEHMEELFGESRLDGIYLNFSDPWPKAKHAKRRLTYRQRLKDYAWAIKPGGFIEIKTDNEGLFEFTLEEIEACREAGIRPVEMTRNLHAETTTEYEDKFSGRGKNINFVKVIIDKQEK